MSFQVQVQPAGRTFTVEGEETLLEAALRANVGLPYGCKNGACGTCRAQVLKGEWVQGAHGSTALSASQAQAGMLLPCCARPKSDMVIEARVLEGVGDIPVRKMPVRVAKIERPSAHVAIVHLHLPAQTRLQFHAGQYLELILRDGTRRCYSMANAPHRDTHIELHIRHMPGGRFTDTLFGGTDTQLKERDLLRIEAPLGTFFLREDSARPILLLASGTGFAPIKAIFEHILHKGINRDATEKPGRSVVLYWGARTQADLYLNALPQQWALEQPHFKYVPVLSEPTEADAWHGRTGFVHHAVMADMPDLSGYDVYACGTPAMVAAAHADFTKQCGLPEDQFYSDAFVSEADKAK